MTARRPESVLVVVYTTRGQVLLLQRADDPDFWQSVTGSLEMDERPAQAAARELFEETGLRRPALHNCHTRNRYVIRQDWLYRYPAGVTHNTEHVFVAEFERSEPVSLSPTEHLNAKWVDVQQSLEQLWSATNRQAVIDFVLPRLS